MKGFRPNLSCFAHAVSVLKTAARTSADLQARQAPPSRLTCPRHARIAHEEVAQAIVSQPSSYTSHESFFYTPRLLEKFWL